LASAGVPPTAPDLMSGSPRPPIAAHTAEIVYAPTPHQGTASLMGASRDTMPIDPLSASRLNGRRGDPRVAAASTPPQPPVAATSTLPRDIPHSTDAIEQLANMDPAESADVLAAIIAEAPQVC
jgi:hypothetical protein